MMGHFTMKTMIKASLILISIIMMGCVNNQYQSIRNHASNGDKPFDAMPREGWATDPNFSYQMYSYYPMDFTYGGFYQPFFHPYSRLQ